MLLYGLSLIFGSSSSTLSDIKKGVRDAETNDLKYIQSLIEEELKEGRGND